MNYTNNRLVMRSKTMNKGDKVKILSGDFQGRSGKIKARHFNVLPSEIKKIKAGVIRDGFLEQILISHDRCFKVMLRSYGGGGYSYILKNTVPEMLKKGMIEEQIHTILVENPKRALTFA